MITVRLVAAAREMVKAHDAWIDHAVVEPPESDGLWPWWRLDEIDRLNAIDRGLRYLNDVLAECGQAPVTVHDFRPRCQALLHPERRRETA